MRQGLQHRVLGFVWIETRSIPVAYGSAGGGTLSPDLRGKPDSLICLGASMKVERMSARSLTIAAIGAAAIALAVSAPQFAQSAADRAQLGALSTSEGIYVDRKGFGIVKGAAKSVPTEAQLTKLGAQEVKEGAIIIRVGEKLYLVDTDPSAKSMYNGWAEEAFRGGA
jgi:hypothetical protein